MLSFASYPYSQSSSESSSPSSSPLDWADWVPECLHPAIAIASEMSSSSYPHHHYHDDDDDDDDDDEPITADDEDLESSAPPSGEEEEGAYEEDEDEDEEEAVAEEEQGGRPEQGALQEEDMDLFSDEDGIPLGHLRRQRYQQQIHQQNRHQAASHTHGQQGSQLNRSLACLSCKEMYTSRRAGTCRECYDEASETEEALKKEIEELHARIAFLKSWASEAMEEDCADISLECVDGSKIRAHRAVLISRSTVFKAMLESKMEESRTNTIKITDFTYEVLRLFIHYLYTAEIYPESLEECAVDLLALAEKYNVKQLKLVCERYMVSKLNCGNALSNFEYASLHGAKTLKQAALSTILENLQELIGRSDYQELVNRDAKLVVEIFESYLAKQTGKVPTQ